MIHPFTQRLREKKGPLFGLSLNTFDPIFVEIAGRVGIDVVWIEMEHSSLTMREAETLCRLITGSNMISLIRLPNAERETVLKAAETGAEILMAPMTSTPEVLQRLVEHGRYAPAGNRGYYVPSRAMNYGLGGNIAQLRQEANDRLMLWGQIETLQALDDVKRLCQVPGIDGLFMGPGDLSAAFGVPGESDHPKVMAGVAKGLECSRRHKRLCGTVCSTDKIAHWAQRGMNVMFLANNVAFYVRSATALQEQIAQQMATVAAAKVASIISALP